MSTKSQTELECIQLETQLEEIIPEKSYNEKMQELLAKMDLVIEKTAQRKNKR